MCEHDRGLHDSWAVLAQCMSAETKLELLRQRMAGMSVCVAELRSKELEYMSLVRIQVRLFNSLSRAQHSLGRLDAPYRHLPAQHGVYMVASEYQFTLNLLSDMIDCAGVRCVAGLLLDSAGLCCAQTLR